MNLVIFWFLSIIKDGLEQAKYDIPYTSTTEGYEYVRAWVAESVFSPLDIW